MESFWGAIVGIFGFFGTFFVIEKIPIKISPLGAIKKILLGDLIEKIDQNEKARIKSRANEIKFELSNYEKMLLNDIELNNNDIVFVREIYDEYHNDLKQNHLGTLIYENIESMYKKQLEKKKNV